MEENLETAVDQETAGFDEDFLSEVEEVDTMPVENLEQEKEQPLNQDEETVDLTFIGQNIPLPAAAVKQTAEALGMDAESVIATLQKGMNYDHVAAERERLQNSPELQQLDHYASLSGMTRGEYVDFLQQQSEAALLQQAKADLQKMYPYEDEVDLEAAAKSNLEFWKDEMQRQEEERQEMERQAEISPWVEFFKANPLMDVDAVPPEVLAMVGGGMSPMAAFLQYQNQDLQRELAAAKQNQAAVAKDMGSVRTEAADLKGDEALFAAGFDQF